MNVEYSTTSFSNRKITMDWNIVLNMYLSIHYITFQPGFWYTKYCYILVLMLCRKFSDIYGSFHLHKDWALGFTDWAFSSRIEEYSASREGHWG